MLTKKQALRLLPAVVDDEATDQERAAFFEYLKRDPELEREYYSTLQIKRLLSEHLPKKGAPDYLKDRIMQRIQEEVESEKFNQLKTPLHKIEGTNHKGAGWKSLTQTGLRYIAAATIILVLTLMVVQLLERSTLEINDDFFVIENITAEHFSNFSGESIEPHFSTASPREAETYLSDHYGLEMTIPHLSNTSFSGVVLADFHSGMKVPMLMYIQEEIGETIYIFAMNMNQLHNFKNMKREKNAAESCSTQTDYFVNDINGTHVVSWLWGDNWYSAVSNHNGHDLAALVGPLNQD